MKLDRCSANRLGEHVSQHELRRDIDQLQITKSNSLTKITEAIDQML